MANGVGFGFLFYHRLKDYILMKDESKFYNWKSHHKRQFKKNTKPIILQVGESTPNARLAFGGCD